MSVNTGFDGYAAGPFTRVQLVVKEGYTVWAVPRNHPLGERGDLVHTIVSPDREHNYFGECK